LIFSREDYHLAHVTIEYSANMEARTDIAGLCDALRLAAIATGTLPLAGVRVRALRADHVSVADGNPDHEIGRASCRERV